MQRITVTLYCDEAEVVDLEDAIKRAMMPSGIVYLLEVEDIETEDKP